MIDLTVYSAPEGNMPSLTESKRKFPLTNKQRKSRAAAKRARKARRIERRHRK